MRAVVTCLLFVSGVALAQPPSDTLNVLGRDEAHVAGLSGANGVSDTAGRVAVYVPAGTLSGDELRALAESLDRGFTGLIAFTHSPRSWQRVPSKVSFYFHPEMLISHADPERDRLFIAFPRLQSGEAPLLHEAVHVLLSPTAEFMASHPSPFDENVESSVWLSEGLASYVGQSVAAETGVEEGDPLGWGMLAEVDAKCAAVSSTPLGAEILPYIGAPGMPAGLMTRSRRLEVAPTVLRLRHVVREVRRRRGRHRGSRRRDGRARVRGCDRQGGGHEHRRVARRVAERDRSGLSRRGAPASTIWPRSKSCAAVPCRRDAGARRAR